MKLFSFLSTLLSNRRDDAPADAGPVAPEAPVAWAPRTAAPRSSRKNQSKNRQPAPPHAAPPQAAAPETPVAKSRTQPVAKTAPPAGARPEPAPARDAAGRPAVPPVGGRGETDLAPSRAAVESVTYPSAESVSYPSGEGSADDMDRAAIRELFSDIAAGQAAPVKTFISDLRARNATGEWLQVCRPVMAVLVESAMSLGLDDAVAPMTQFVSALDLAAESQEGKDGPIDGAERDVLLESYEALTKSFPEVFAPGGVVKRRDSMLLHAILSQVQGVGLVTSEALYAVGLTSVETLSQASPGDLSSTTGVSMSLCEAICARLKEHRLELESSAHLPEERRFSGRLTELLRALIREHEAFVVLSEETGFDDARAERKRVVRRDRNLCALKIEATLIEMGAVECADAMRVLSFDRRIEHMEKFLGVRVAKRAAEHR